MKLIFALGNPEARYSGTRHNIGFTVADQFVADHDAAWKQATKHKALVASLQIGESKVIVAKPTTYYNLVGESYQALTHYYGIDPTDVLIVHDDLALDYGTIRTRLGGSGGGSKGIRSLNAHGGDATVRLRIGIGNSLLEQVDAADFVLGKFSQTEQQQLPAVIERSSELIEQFVAGHLELTTHR